MFTSRLLVTSLRASRTRGFATEPKPSGFFGKIVDNLRQELGKNKEMKENIAKFREEAQKLEQSDALKQARRKFEIVESEATKGSEVLKEKLGSVTSKFTESIKDSDLAKKASDVTSQLGKQAQQVAGSVADTSAKLANTTTFKAVSEAASVVREEIVDSTYGDRIYRPPARLRKRVEAPENVTEQVIAPNETATGMELHKDSRFYQSWEKFKDSNPYVNKMLDWKIKYDESDNTVIRASRALTSKVTEIMGGLFQRTELSEVLTEIMKVDPNFEKESFVRFCEKEIIPNVLEAMCRQDLEVLKDWCYDTAYAVMSHPLDLCKQKGLKLDTKVLDISQVDLAMGRVLDQGPVLVITFTAQMVTTVRDALGKIVEGDPDKVLRVNHAWVLCRDPQELNPQAAWRLLEFSSSASEQLV